MEASHIIYIYANVLRPRKDKEVASRKWHIPASISIALGESEGSKSPSDTAAAAARTW